VVDIINPFTRIILARIEGYTTSDQMFERLNRFIDSNPLDKMSVFPFLCLLLIKFIFFSYPNGPEASIQVLTKNDTPAIVPPEDESMQVDIEVEGDNAHYMEESTKTLLEQKNAAVIIPFPITL